MKIISFAWTTEALLSGNKTVTRRTWKKQLVNVGDIVQAYDRSPRFKGKKVALIEITSVSREPLNMITYIEEQKEGGLWGSSRSFVDSFLSAYKGMEETDLVWRIEFRIKEVINNK